MFVASYQRTMASAKPKMRQPEETRVVNLVEERAKRERAAREEARKAALAAAAAALNARKEEATAKRPHKRGKPPIPVHARADVLPHIDYLAEELVGLRSRARRITRWFPPGFVPTPGDNGPHPGTMIAMAAAWYGVTMADVLTNSRSDRIMKARRDAMGAIYCNCRVDGRPYTTMEIARLMDKDHATVIHSLRKLGLRD